MNSADRFSRQLPPPPPGPPPPHAITYSEYKRSLSARSRGSPARNYEPSTHTTEERQSQRSAATSNHNLRDRPTSHPDQQALQTSSHKKSARPAPSRVGSDAAEHGASTGQRKATSPGRRNSPVKDPETRKRSSSGSSSDGKFRHLPPRAKYKAKRSRTAPTHDTAYAKVTHHNIIGSSSNQPAPRSSEYAGSPRCDKTLPQSTPRPVAEHSFLIGEPLRPHPTLPAESHDAAAGRHENASPARVAASRAGGQQRRHTQDSPRRISAGPLTIYDAHDKSTSSHKQSTAPKRPRSPAIEERGRQVLVADANCTDSVLHDQKRRRKLPVKEERSRSNHHSSSPNAVQRSRRRLRSTIVRAGTPSADQPDLQSLNHERVSDPRHPGGGDEKEAGEYSRQHDNISQYIDRPLESSKVVPRRRRRRRRSGRKQRARLLYQQKQSAERRPLPREPQYRLSDLAQHSGVAYSGPALYPLDQLPDYFLPPEIRASRWRRPE
ncbi:hypothetical protein L7F22_057986, partial [Adiantum nelumboides]|nr:hypothetical protein [Adiantum nelumboides]